jgi:hypothetical protein
MEEQRVCVLMLCYTAGSKRAQLLDFVIQSLPPLLESGRRLHVGLASALTVHVFL